MSGSFTMVGTDYVKPGLEKVFPLSPSRVAATAPGKKTCVARKQDANEDGLLWDPQHEVGELWVVADGHYGSLSSKLAISRFPKLLQAGTDSLVRRLMRAHFLLDDEVQHARRRDPMQANTATTLLSMVVIDGVCTYASTGDSRLWIVRGEDLIDVLHNESVNLFIGDGQHHLFQMVDLLKDRKIVDNLTERSGIIEVLIRLHELHQGVKRGSASVDSVAPLLSEIGAAAGLTFPFSAEELLEPWHELHLNIERSLPQTGSFKVRPGDLVLLASDGIDEEMSGISAEQLVTILNTAKNLATRAEKLLAVGMGRHGGNDNLSFLLGSF